MKTVEHESVREIFEHFMSKCMKGAHVTGYPRTLPGMAGVTGKSRRPKDRHQAIEERTASFSLLCGEERYPGTPPLRAASLRQGPAPCWFS